MKNATYVRSWRIGIHQGPQYRPLILHLPRWNAIRTLATHVQSIDRFRLRQEMLAATPRWLQFEQAVRNYILNRHSELLTDPVRTALTWNTKSDNCMLIIFHPAQTCSQS